MAKHVHDVAWSDVYRFIPCSMVLGHVLLYHLVHLHAQVHFIAAQIFYPSQYNSIFYIVLMSYHIRCVHTSTSTYPQSMHYCRLYTDAIIHLTKHITI